VLLHGGGQNPAAIEIHIPVPQWVGYGFTHGLKPGEMNHPINRSPTVKGVIDRVQITNITLDKIQSIGACELLHSSKSLWAAVVEVAENHQFIPLLQKDQSGMAPD
jgi:hypothetical protein